MTTSSLTKKWREAFITELRLRGASGVQIGDELALVETHCLDAGAEVEEAFGDPVAYARSVVIACGGPPLTLGLGEGRRIVARTLVQATGLMILLGAVLALRDGRQATFTGVELVMVLVLAVLLVLLVMKADAVLRFVAQRSVVVVVAFGAALTVLLVLIALFVAPAAVAFAVSVPAGLAAAAGGLLLVLPSVIQSPSTSNDAIVEPLTDARSLPVRRWPDVALRWWVPAAGLALCALVLIMG